MALAPYEVAVASCFESAAPGLAARASWVWALLSGRARAPAAWPLASMAVLASPDGLDRLLLRHGPPLAPLRLPAEAAGAALAPRRALAELSNGQIAGVIIGSVAALALLVLCGFLAYVLVRCRRSKITPVIDISVSRECADEAGLRKAAQAGAKEKSSLASPKKQKAGAKVLQFAGIDGDDDDDDDGADAPRQKVKTIDSVHVTKRRLSHQEEKLDEEINAMPKFRAQDSIHVTKKRNSVREEKEAKEELEKDSWAVKPQDSVAVTKRRLSRTSFCCDSAETGDASASEPKPAKPKIKNSIFVTKSRSDKKERAPRSIKDSIWVKQDREKLKGRDVQVHICTEGQDMEEPSEEGRIRAVLRQKAAQKAAKALAENAADESEEASDETEDAEHKGEEEEEDGQEHGASVASEEWH